MAQAAEEVAAVEAGPDELLEFMRQRDPALKEAKNDELLSFAVERDPTLLNTPRIRSRFNRALFERAGGLKTLRREPTELPTPEERTIATLESGALATPAEAQLTLEKAAHYAFGVGVVAEPAEAADIKRKLPWLPDPMAESVASLHRVATPFANFVMTPGGLATLGLAATPAGPVIALAFAVDAAAKLPEETKELGEALADMDWNRPETLQVAGRHFEGMAQRLLVMGAAGAAKPLGQKLLDRYLGDPVVMEAAKNFEQQTLAPATAAAVAEAPAAAPAATPTERVAAAGLSIGERARASIGSIRTRLEAVRTSLQAAAAAPEAIAAELQRQVQATMAAGRAAPPAAVDAMLARVDELLGAAEKAPEQAAEALADAEAFVTALERTALAFAPPKREEVTPSEEEGQRQRQGQEGRDVVQVTPVAAGKAPPPAPAETPPAEPPWKTLFDAENISGRQATTLRAVEASTTRIEQRKLYQSDPAPATVVTLKNGVRKQVLENGNWADVPSWWDEAAAPEAARPGEARTVFDLPDSELADWFDEHFAPREEARPEAVRPGKYTFANYNEFRDWMNARYAERDLEGMMNAFKEAPTANKVAYIKEHRASAQHLKDWISHLATGSPLPTTDPPMARTTPRPMPGAWTAPPPGATGTAPPGGGPTAGAAPPGTPPPQPPPPPPPTQPFGMPVKMPTTPGPMVRASEVIKGLAELMERPIRFGHIGAGKATLGIFIPKLEVARIRRANAIPVAAHETAHGLERLDRRALGGITRSQWVQAMPQAARSEFQGLDYNPMLRRTYEGFAEFVRHYLTLGDTAAIAPNAHGWFETRFLATNPGLREGFAALREQIVRFQDQGAETRIRSMIRMLGEEARKPIGERVRRGTSRFLTLFSDDLRTLEQVEREMMSGKMALGEVSPTKVARAATQSSGAMAREWALRGMTDLAGNRTGPSLKEIFARPGVKGDETGAIVYAVAKRAQELHARGIDPGITKVDANYHVAHGATPARNTFSTELRAWTEGALEYLKDASGISQQTFDRVIAANQFYVPFYRVLEEQMPGFTSGGRRLGDLPSPVKRIKGSGHEIHDPIASMWQQANQFISVANKTRVAKALVNMVEQGEGFGRFVVEIPAAKVPLEINVGRIAGDLRAAGADLSQADLDAVLTVWLNSPRNPTGPNIVSFVRNGERRYYELDAELYETVQALDHQRIHPFLDATLGTAARTIRLGATGVRAGFTLLTNPIRDFSTMVLQTGHNPVKAAGLMAKHLGKQIGLRDSEIKDLWRATGGEISQPLGLDRASLQRDIGEVLANDAKRKLWHVVRHPVEFARDVLSFTEAAPRLAEFEATLREMGWRPGQALTGDMAIEAANRAAEVTINFRRAGAWGRQINQAVAFWNPAMQGLSKFGRAHADNLKSAAARGIGLMTTVAVSNWLLNKDDESWQDLPPWAKYGFLNFKIGGEWIRFPMPFEWWYAYGVAPMSGLDAIYKKRPKEVAEAARQAIGALMPGTYGLPVPSVAVPLLEAKANINTFIGKPILTQSEQAMALVEQAKPWTTQTTRRIADILSIGGVEVSPAKIEHVLNGETGGLWGDLIGTAERVAGVASPEAVDEPADLPVVGRLFIRDAQSAAVDEAYTRLAYLRSRQHTADKLEEAESARAARYQLSEGELKQLSALENFEQAAKVWRQELKEARTREERIAIFKALKEDARAALDAVKEP